MGWKFRKSIKLSKGVRFNINKNSFGVSAGGNGIRYSVNSDGRKTSTVGVPGGKIAAGYPTTMFADVIDYIDIPADMARGNKELFALKTKGKSMEPNFIEGDILIFEKTEDCENGQFCAVAVNGDDATFKKVTKTDTGIMLQPLNPAFETKFYTNEQIASLPVQIIGVLKQIRRNF